MNILLILNKIAPKPIWKAGASLYHSYLKWRYLQGYRPLIPGETTKAKNRRIKESFFEKYTQGKGLDIGFGGDLIVPNATGWDFEHGDAQFLNGLENEKFDFVYSSHTLEHMVDPAISLRNWYRVLKKGGYLILYIPHRELYEKKKNLPSRFNPNHTAFYLVNEDDPPDTLGILSLIQRNLQNYEIIYAKECGEGHTITDPLKHSDGEYSIEVVLRKIK